MSYNGKVPTEAHSNLQDKNQSSGPGLLQPQYARESPGDLFKKQVRIQYGYIPTRGPVGSPLLESGPHLSTKGP